MKRKKTSQKSKNTEESRRKSVEGKDGQDVLTPSGESSYYYDDAYGYERFEPDSKPEDEDKNERSNEA